MSDIEPRWDELVKKSVASIEDLGDPNDCENENAIVWAATRIKELDENCTQAAKIIAIRNKTIEELEKQKVRCEQLKDEAYNVLKDLGELPDD